MNIPLNKLNELALLLGSDVPFFIKAKPAIGLARGEMLEQSNLYIEHPILIVNPGIHISTREAFSHINPVQSEFNYNYFLEKDKIDYKYLRSNLKNDFEKYVFNKYEEICNIKDLMKECEALFTLMSGTGSTIYGIFDNIVQAQDVIERLPEDYFTFISK